MNKTNEKITTSEILSLDISSFSKLTSIEQINTISILNILGNIEYMGNGIRETELLTTMKTLFFKESIFIR